MSGILGQSAPAATTNTVVYTVPTAAISTFTISVCNTGLDAISVRVAIAAAADPTSAEWIEYNTSVPAGGVLQRTGVVAQGQKNVVAYVSAATAAVSVYGFEEAV